MGGIHEGGTDDAMEWNTYQLTCIRCVCINEIADWPERVLPIFVPLTWFRCDANRPPRRGQTQVSRLVEEQQQDKVSSDRLCDSTRHDINKSA
jgi:hypothetical protein